LDNLNCHTQFLHQQDCQDAGDCHPNQICRDAPSGYSGGVVPV
jgi:hypothetical protein